MDKNDNYHLTPFVCILSLAIKHNTVLRDVELRQLRQGPYLFRH